MPLARRTLALALTLTRGIGGRTLVKALTRHELLGRPMEQLLDTPAEALRAEYGMTAPTAERWRAERRQRFEEAQALEERLDRQGVSVITALDAAYPIRVEQMDADPPGVLFAYGNFALVESRTFAVLSSRNSPPAALDLIERCAEEAVLGGETLIAGHDTPEYQRAAVVPLRWGAPRIVVLDRGLFQALGEDLSEEPFRAARLWRFQFDPTTDLALSPVLPSGAYHRNSNRVRDRLIASLSARLDFVAVNEGGNMERSLRAALKAGRPVRVCDLSLRYREYRRLGAGVIKA
jgi:DNA processing protein